MPGTTTVDGLEIEHLLNASLRINASELTFYLDIFEDALAGEQRSGELFLSTHAHFDHYDPGTISALAAPNATLVAHADSDVSEVAIDTHLISAGDSLTINSVSLSAVPAHNVVRTRPNGDHFHSASEGVGYVFTIDGVRFYHTGDTAPLDHMADISADVMFVPIGGKAVMGLQDAYWALHMVQPDIAIPIHYGHIDGSKPDTDGFADLLDTLADEDNIQVQPRLH